MTYRTRINYTPKQKAEMWDRWQRGESLSSIGRLFGRESSSVFGILSKTGGIRPSPRKRSCLALTLSEREEISRGLVAGSSMREIAYSLNRSPSTISREINRNGGYDDYRATQAEQATWDRAHRPKKRKLACHPMLKHRVATKLKRYIKVFSFRHAESLKKSFNCTFVLNVQYVVLNNTVLKK